MTLNTELLICILLLVAFVGSSFFQYLFHMKNLKEQELKLREEQRDQERDRHIEQASSMQDFRDHTSQIGRLMGEMMEYWKEGDDAREDNENSLRRHLVNAQHAVKVLQQWHWDEDRNRMQMVNLLSEMRVVRSGKEWMELHPTFTYRLLVPNVPITGMQFWEVYVDMNSVKELPR